MKTTVACFGLIFAMAVQAQQPAVPRVTYFNGAVTDAAGKPQTGTVGITFALYEEQEGGPALWSETQNVPLDGQGRYTVLLGSTQPEGLPLDLFASGKARWLGVTPQVAGVAEQARVLLVGVPYALKAADADTLGGLPASAFLAAASTGSAVASSTASPKLAAPRADGPVADVTGTGAADYIPLWSTADKLGTSVLYQSGTGGTTKIGIHTATPASTLDANGTTTVSSGNLIVSSLSTGPPYNSGNVGIGTSSPSAPLHIMGTSAPLSGLSGTSSGLLLGSAGNTSYKWLQSYSGALVLNQWGNNVGIATTNPTATLEVAGTAKFDGLTTFAANLGVIGNISASGSVTASTVEGLTGGLSSAVEGVYGEANGSAGAVGSVGVEGAATVASTSGPTYGVVGTTASSYAGSTGVYGAATNSSGSSATYGVYGTTATANALVDGAGVAGTTGALSATGACCGGSAGVWGDSNNDSPYAGVRGTADENFAGYFGNNGGNVTLYARNNGTGDVFWAYGRTGNCIIANDGNLTCTGTITPGVQGEDGRQARLYTIASPENWFEDFGSGQLSAGSAHISLDPAFASTVNTGESYHVFLTPNGDCKGLYVAAKTAGGFEVRELGGGTSGVSFDYRIVAKRRGYENVRMEDITDRVNKQRELQAKMLAKRTERRISVPPGPAAREIAPRVPVANTGGAR